MNKLSFREKYSYGIGALGKDLAYAIVSSYLMIYFTDAIGLNPAFVGVLFLVARMWDAFNDPMMGMVVDNTRSKWGKFRPWILIGTVVNAAVIVFLLFKSELAVFMVKSLRFIFERSSLSFISYSGWRQIICSSSLNKITDIALSAASIGSLSLYVFSPKRARFLRLIP